VTRPSIWVDNLTMEYPVARRGPRSSEGSRQPGYVDHRIAKSSHRQLILPPTGRIVTVAVQTKNGAGRLGNRSFKDAGVLRLGRAIPSYWKRKTMAPSVLKSRTCRVSMPQPIPGRRRRGIRSALRVHLTSLAERGHPIPTPRAQVKVLRVVYSGPAKAVVDLVGAAALLGRHRSAAKAAPSRANGAKGGRPRKGAAFDRYGNTEPPRSGRTTALELGGGLEPISRTPFRADPPDRIKPIAKHTVRGSRLSELVQRRGSLEH
jgi:hypothetical protein